MSQVTQGVPITTDGAGAAERDVRVPGQLLAVQVEVGDLEAFDLTLTEQPGSIALLAVTGIEADVRYQPGVPMAGPDGASLAVDVAAGEGTVSVGPYVPPVVTGRIHVSVANGGDHKSGRLVLVVSR